MSVVTVTEAAVNRLLTNLGHAKVQLQILGADDDGFLSTCIAQASRMVGAHCNRVFPLDRVTEKVVGDGDLYLYLSRRPIVTVHGVEFDGDAVDADDYETLDADTGILYNQSGWTDTRRIRSGMGTYIDPRTGYYLWEVDYTAGYPCYGDDGDEPAADVPEDLERICVDLVAILYDDRKRNLLRTYEREGDAGAGYRKVQEFLRERCVDWVCEA